MTDHLIYQNDATVWIERGENNGEKFEKLDDAIDHSGFLANLEDAFIAKHGPDAGAEARDAFSIVIKPNIMTASVHDDETSVYTCPQAVEHLIGRIHEAGFHKIAVVESQNVYSYAYTGRTVPAVAQMCGYSGCNYDIVDLTDDTQRTVNYGGCLGEDTAGATWADADYRISFAKNKTHWQSVFTACLKNVYGCFPKWDKMKLYHGTPQEWWAVTILSLELHEVHFGFLDAWVSGDGLTGHVWDPTPKRTLTWMASPNIFALDWVAGEKMGLNPVKSPMIAQALGAWGPIKITRKGPMNVYYSWDNIAGFVPPIINTVEKFHHIVRLVTRASTTPGDPRFKPVSKWQLLFEIPQELMRLGQKMGVFQAHWEKFEDQIFDMTPDGGVCPMQRP